MGETSRNAKVCATCQYWMGYRDISSTGRYVRYQEKGQCTSAVQVVVEKKQGDMIPVVTGINGMPCDRI